MKRPHGLLGVKWGDMLADAKSTLGIECSDLRPWRGGSEFESCSGNRQIEWEGMRGDVNLVVAAGRVEGIELSLDAPYDRVRPAVERWISTAPTPPPLYVTWRRGEVVHLEPLNDWATLLIAGGPKFGKHFQGWLIGSGIAALGSELRK